MDLAFEAILCQIFGTDFIESFKAKRPAAWVDLTIAFEARKRTAAPGRANSLNILLPFSFIDFYKRQRGQSVETALRKSKYGSLTMREIFYNKNVSKFVSFCQYEFHKMVISRDAETVCRGHESTLSADHQQYHQTHW